MSTPGKIGYSSGGNARAKYGFELFLRYAHFQETVPNDENVISLSFNKIDIKANKIDALIERTGGVKHIYCETNLPKEDEKYFTFIYESIAYLRDELNLITGYSCTGGEYTFNLLIDYPISTRGLTGVELNRAVNGWVQSNLRFFDRKWNIFLETRDAEAQRSAHLPKNLEKMNNYLLKLNYDAQSYYLETQINSQASIEILKAEINGKLMQDWLLYRTLRTHDMIKSSPFKHYFITDSPFRSRKSLTLSRMLLDNNDAFEYIERLCSENERSSTVVFAVSGMEILPSGKLDLFLEDFLNELRAAIRRDREIAKKKFRFFLVGDFGWISRHDRLVVQPSELWGTLSEFHIDQWMSKTLGITEEETAEDFLQNMARSYNPTGWNDWRTRIDLSSLEYTISSLCSEFLGKDSIDNLIQIWDQKLKSEKVL